MIFVVQRGEAALRNFAYILIAVAMAGCSTAPMSWRLKNADYWQRADLRTATYLDPVEAQRILNRDIARCTVDIKDQERMAIMRNSIPADGRGVDPKSAAGYMAGWDTPERDGYLHAEHLPYHNFETCMMYNGWERVSTVQPDVAQRSRNAWREHTDPGYTNRKATESATGGASSGNGNSGASGSYFNM